MDAAYSYNPHVQATAAPPIPLAGQWSQRFVPTPTEPLLNLAQGVPGDPPPPELLQKLAEAAADPTTTGYGGLRGDIGLRRELARDVNEVYGVKEGGKAVDAEQDVVITSGCNLVRRLFSLLPSSPSSSPSSAHPYCPSPSRPSTPPFLPWPAKATK